jgi:hypothetical protein
LRHGLSRPLQLDPASFTKLDAIVALLNADDPANPSAATEVALAQLELWQIRKVRAQLMAGIDLESCGVQTLRRLAALRYERYARTKRRRASREL